MTETSHSQISQGLKILARLIVGRIINKQAPRHENDSTVVLDCEDLPRERPPFKEKTATP